MDALDGYVAGTMTYAEAVDRIEFNERRFPGWGTTLAEWQASPAGGIAVMHRVELQERYQNTYAGPADAAFKRTPLDERLHDGSRVEVVFFEQGGEPLVAKQPNWEHAARPACCTEHMVSGLIPQLGAHASLEQVRGMSYEGRVATVRKPGLRPDEMDVATLRSLTPAHIRVAAEGLAVAARQRVWLDSWGRNLRISPQYGIGFYDLTRTDHPELVLRDLNFKALYRLLDEATWHIPPGEGEAVGAVILDAAYETFKEMGARFTLREVYDD